MNKFRILLCALAIIATPASSIDVNGQLKNAQLEKLTTDPSSNQVEARIFWDTNDDLFRIYDGSSWLSIADLTRSQNLSNKTLASPTVTTTLLLQNPSGSQPTLQLSEDPDNGTNTVSVKASASIADYTLTLPTDDGSANQYLQTDGSGVLSWSNTFTSPTINSPTIATPTITGGSTLREETLLQNTTGSQPTLSLSEDPDNGTNKTIIKANASIADYTLTLPVDDGNANEFMQTDGSGVLSWSNTFTSPKVNENVALTTTATKLNYLTSATGTTGTSSTNVVFSASPALVSPTVTSGATIRGSTLLQNTSGAMPTLLLSEDPDNGTDAVTLQADDSFTSYTLTMPVDDGGSGQILSTDGSGVLSWASPFTNPMTTTGDIVYSSDGSGTPARLGVGASTTVLHGGTIPAYSQIVNADVSSSAAIVNSKLSWASPSRITLESGGGLGTTTHNHVVYWLTLRDNNGGSDLSYTSSSTDGDKVTVNTTGLYAVSCDLKFTGAADLGITINSEADPSTLSFANLAAFTSLAAGAYQNIAAVLYLTATDVVRVTTTAGGTISGNSFVGFRIVRIW